MTQAIIHTSPEGTDLDIKWLTGFRRPMAVNIDRRHYVYVVDGDVGQVHKFDPLLRYCGALQGTFGQPQSIAFDATGNLFVTEFANARIQRFTEEGFYTGLMGITSQREFTNGYVQEGTIRGGNHQGMMKGPASGYFDSRGNFFVTDAAAHCVMKFSPFGEFAGWIGAMHGGYFTQGWQTHGSPVPSQQPGGFDRPQVTVVDPSGTLYIADTWNHRVQRFDVEGAFTGWIGALQDGSLTRGWTLTGLSAPTAMPGGFNAPISLDLDRHGNLLVLEFKNPRIQKFAPDGSFLGWFGGRTDGSLNCRWERDGFAHIGDRPGVFFECSDIKVRDDTLYVVDTGNKRVQIIRFLPSDRG